MQIKKLRLPFDLLTLLLLIFIFVGLSLRIHNLDSPPIGYHNMKEIEYLSEAREFFYHDDYLHRRISFLGMMSPTGPDNFEEYVQLPIIPWLTLLTWKIFGIHLWLPRMIIVLFSLGSIPLSYYLFNELTEKKEISVVAAFLMAIMPLAVFFGRNIQPETPALFFILLTSYYYLRWTKNLSPKYLLVSLIAFSISGLFKYTFMIFAIPLLFLFPFDKIKNETNKKKLLRQIPLIILSISPLFLWALLSKFTNVNSEQLFTYYRINIFEIFTSGYWEKYFYILKVYFNSNFTVFYTGIALIGILFCFRESKTSLSKFILGSAFMAIPYSMILSDYIRQHSYYQIPFLPLICLASAYGIYKISEVKLNLNKNLKYIIILGLIFLSIPFVIQNIDNHYDTIFFGLDVAGNSINEFSNKADRIFISGHAQTVGMLWSADRYGDFLPTTLDMFKFGENERHMKWIFVYDNSGISKLRENTEIWDYINKSYFIKEVGFIENGENLEQKYIILEKGGSIDMSGANLERPKLAAVYKTSYGLVKLYSSRAR